jgi:hypothetical protein
MAMEMPMPDPALGAAAGDLAGQPRPEFGVIDAVGAVGAEVGDLMPGLSQPGGKLVLQGEAGMIGGKGDAHARDLGQAAGIRQ